MAKLKTTSVCVCRFFQNELQAAHSLTICYGIVSIQFHQTEVQKKNEPETKFVVLNKGSK
jgi:hypothetical protein